MKRLLFPALLAMSLAGCGSIVASTAAKLGLMSPLTADPGQFAVALSLPDGIDIADDGATLTLFATLASTGETRRETFVLLEEGNVYRINPADLERARRVQAEVRAWEENDPRDSSGGLSINIAPCVIGAGPAPDATVSFAIQTRPDGPFETLLRNGPLSEVANQDDLAQLPQCAS